MQCTVVCWIFIHLFYMLEDDACKGMENIANNNLLNSGQLNLPEVRSFSQKKRREKVVVPVPIFVCDVMQMPGYSEFIFLSLFVFLTTLI